MQKIHQLLGYLGLIPFIGLSALHIYGWSPAYELLVTYSALIISFLAGVLWMAAMDRNLSLWLALLSNVVMLASWALLIINPGSGVLYAFTLLLITLLMVEKRQLKAHYPSRFYELRSRLTLIASIALFSAELFS